MIRILFISCLILSFIFSSCWAPMEPHAPTVQMREFTASEKEVMRASNALGIKLLAGLSTFDEDGENIFISPLSISMALGMALHGARGETRDEMKRVLEFHNLTIDEINEAYRGLIDLLPNVDPSVDILIANSMWYRYTFPVLMEFIETNKKYFDAEVQGLDFDSQEAPKIIDNWVKEKTNGLIDQIAPEEIDPLTMMFLINAVYFKGNWTNQFDKDKTHNADFRLPDGGTVPVKLMTQNGKFRYYQSRDFEILDLPYGDKKFSMTIVLPPAGSSIHEFTSSITGETWRDWLAYLPEQETEIDIFIPRFQLEYDKSLKEVLKVLGMNLAFLESIADFTGLYDTTKEPRNAYIEDVMHKTFVDVNEEGTEAAAVTSVIIGVDSAPPAFRVDRPFIFAIRENSSDTILFIGKIVIPESE